MERKKERKKVRRVGEGDKGEEEENKGEEEELKKKNLLNGFGKKKEKMKTNNGTCMI